MHPRLAAAGAALVVTLSLALSGCSGDDDADAGPSEPTSAPTADPGPPLEVGKRLWGTKETGLTQVTTFEPRGARTIVSGYGRYAQSDNHVMGVETNTGDVLWERTVLDPVPGAGGATLWTDDVGVGDDPDLPVAVTVYRSRPDSRYELTVALLDPVTGRLERFSDATTGAIGASGSAYLTVVDASGGVALVNLVRSGSSSSASRLLAVDLRTGRVLWERGGLQAGAVVGDTVLATDGYVTDTPTGGAWQALDLRTGDTRWQREEPDPEVISGLADGLALFVPTSSGSDGPLQAELVDLASGEVLLDAPRDAVGSAIRNDFGSRRAPGDFVAWLDDDDHLVTYAAGDDAPATSEVTVDAPLFGVVGDQVTHVGPGDVGVERQGVVDRAGTPADVTGTGVLFYTDGDLVVTGRYSTSFEVSRQVS